MSNYKTALAVGAAAIMVSTGASAQEAERYYDGFYVSGSIGAEFLEDEGTDSIVFDTDGDGDFDDSVRTAAGADAFSPGFCIGTPVTPGTLPCRGNRRTDGYALRAGFDRRFGDGPLVGGVLLEGALPGVQESLTGFTTTPASYTFGRELEAAVTARARLGLSPGDGRTLFYVTGGGGFGRIEHTFATSNRLNSFTPTEPDDWQLGWQAGGGAEVMLTRNIGLGVEYLYSSFDDSDYVVAVGPGTAPPTNAFLLQSGGTDMTLLNDKFDYHTMRATVSLRF